MLIACVRDHDPMTESRAYLLQERFAVFLLPAPAMLSQDTQLQPAIQGKGKIKNPEIFNGDRSKTRSFLVRDTVLP